MKVPQELKDYISVRGINLHKTWLETGKDSPRKDQLWCMIHLLGQIETLIDQIESKD